MELPEPQKLPDSESPILRVPVEVHIVILQNLATFSDAISFISTCRQLRNVWDTYSTSVISYIGRTCIPGFDDALVAVRATDLATALYKHRVFTAKGIPTTTPPPATKIPIRTLTSQVRKATIAEAIRIMDLKLFVDYSLFLCHGPGAHMHLSCLIQNSSYVPASFLPQPCHYPASLGPRTPAEIAGCEYRIYAAMYRLFAMAAVLTNVYFEPFFTDSPIATTLREGYELYWPRHVDIDPEENVKQEYFAPIRKLERAEIEYLRQWPVFNKQGASEAALEEVFGDLAEYFIEIGRKESILNFSSPSTTNTTTGTSTTSSITPSTTTTSPLQSHDRPLPDAGSIQQIMTLITCYEVWLRMRERMDALSEPVRYTHEKLLYALNKNRIPLKTIPVVFHAIYGTGDAMMPAKLSDFEVHQYGPVPPSLYGTDLQGRPLKHIEVPDVLYQLAAGEMGGPGGVGGGGAGVGGEFVRPYFEFGWAEYGFFEWVLQKYFGLRVCFMWHDIDARYNQFVTSGAAFMDTALFGREIPGVLVAAGSGRRR